MSDVQPSWWKTGPASSLCECVLTRMLQFFKIFIHFAYGSLRQSFLLKCKAPLSYLYTCVSAKSKCAHAPCLFSNSRWVKSVFSAECVLLISQPMAARYLHPSLHPPCPCLFVPGLLAALSRLCHRESPSYAAGLALFHYARLDSFAYGPFYYSCAQYHLPRVCAGIDIYAFCVISCRVDGMPGSSWCTF